jgi:hypothetical protein
VGGQEDFPVGRVVVISLERLAGSRGFETRRQLLAGSEHRLIGSVVFEGEPKIARLDCINCVSCRTQGCDRCSIGLALSKFPGLFKVLASESLDAWSDE